MSNSLEPSLAPSQTAAPPDTAPAPSRSSKDRLRRFVSPFIALWALVALIWQYRPAWTPLSDDARKLALNITAVIGLVFGLAFICKGAFFNHSVVVIDPISVPKELADRGYTGDVIAQRIQDKIRDIYKARERDDELAELHRTDFTATPLERSLPPIEIAGGKMSIAAVVSGVRDLFGLGRANITGEITIEELPGGEGTDGRAGGPPRRYRLSMRRTDKDVIPHDDPADKLEDLLQSAALHVVEKIEPYHAAYYHFAQGKLPEAARLANEALINPRRDDDLAARILQARIQRKKGLHDEALDDLRHVQELFPNSSLPREQIARVLIFKEAYQDALDATDDALKLAGGDRRLAARAHNLAGVALISMKRYDEALARLQTSSALDPTFAAAYFNQAVLFTERQPEDKPAAIAMFRKASDADPHYARAFTSWASLEKKDGALDSAKRLCEKAIAADPKFATAYNLCGEIHLDREDLTEATAMFEEAKQANPKWSTPRLNLVRALRLDGKLDRAIETLKKATPQNPRDARSYAQQSLALTQKATKEQAPNETSTKLNDILKKALRYGGTDQQVVQDVEEAKALLRSPAPLVAPAPTPSN